VPLAGDQLSVVENEARAREVAAYRADLATKKRTTAAPTSFEHMFSALNTTVIEYPVVVKGDVQGSVEAIVSSLNRISTDEIKVRVLHSGVGAITESDVTLAAASRAPLIGFNVRPNAKARVLAERDKVSLRYYDVIYDLIEEVKGEMAGQLAPERIETIVGRAEILQVFPAGKKDKAAGLLVLDGIIRKGLNARLTHDHRVAAPVQGRRVGSPRGHRVRRRASGHERHQAGRHARAVRGRGTAAHAVIWRFRVPAQAGTREGKRDVAKGSAVGTIRPSAARRRAGAPCAVRYPHARRRA